MRTVVRALCLLCLAFVPLPLSAQLADAFVLSPGMVRLRGTAEFSRFDSRFGPGGGGEPLATDLGTPLSSLSFAPLLPLEGELNRFFASLGGDGSLAGPQNLRLGTADLDATAALRTVPLAVAIGVAPGLEVGIGVPLQREEVLYTRFSLGGGTVGVNPDASANAALLARVGEQWSALGQSPLLPIDGSALGRELQRLVQLRVPGESLDLPDSAATIADLNQLLGSEFGVAPLGSSLSPWRLGDADVSARYRFLSTLGDAPTPTDSTGIHYRAAVSVGVRLPTGSQADSIRLLSFLPEAGQAGFGVGLDGDLFVGRRVWTTASLHYARSAGVEVTRRVVSPRAPLASVATARTVRWTPPDRISLLVAPRYRLTDAISLGAQYGLERLGGGTFELTESDGDASVLDSPSGIVQTVGLGMRYSTLPAHFAGSRLLPLEVVLSYQTTLTGPAGAPDASSMSIQANLFHRLFGGPR